MANYYQVTFSTQFPNEEAHEILMAELAELGFESFSSENNLLQAYIPEENFTPDSIESLKKRYHNQVPFTFQYQLIEQKNWNAEWEKNYPPIEVDNTCIVRAPFHLKNNNAAFDIVIEPKMSFGTGHHETTYLMIKTMLSLDFTNTNVLDMGCGTGILGILASMKGADKITAIDIDAWAFENTLENAKRNSIKNLSCIQGDKKFIPADAYDIILANINRNILLEDIPAYVKHLKHPGKLLLSGIYEKDLDVIRDRATSVGLSYVSHQSKNSWISVEFGW